MQSDRAKIVADLAYAFVGSNPTLPIFTRSDFYRFFFPPLRFAERPFDEPPDFLPRLFPPLFRRVLLRRDFAAVGFLPAALPFAFAREELLPFLAVRLAPPFALRLFFEAFFPDAFDPLLDVLLTFAATAFTAFFTFGAVVLLLAARPASAPITPPTTAPTGPAILPSTAPVAAPAVCLEIGGIWMFSEDEPEVSLDS